MISAVPQQHLNKPARTYNSDRCRAEPGNTTEQNNRDSFTAVMGTNIQQEFQSQFNDLVSRLESKQMFQSDWDIASFAVFFIFIGMVLLLVLLVLIRCCCCCCCDEKPKRQKVGVDNFGMEP